VAGKRRGHGEGSIHQRKDGRWVAVIDLGYVGGKRVRKTWYRKTRKEAAAKLTEELANLQRGGVVATADATVEAFLRSWLETSIKESRAPRTVESYTQMVESHIIPEIGRIRLGKLTPKDVQGMMSRKKAAGLSARTVNYLRAILRSALTSAVKQEIVARNVASFTESSRGEKREPKPFTVEETRKFFETIHNDRHEVGYVLAGTYGLRRGEVLGLRWSDIDEDAGVFYIRQQVQRVDGKDQILPLKTKSSRRTLPLTPSVREALERRRAHQAQDQLLAGDRWQEHGLVIASSIGTPLNPGNFYNRYRQKLIEAGFVDEEGQPVHNFHDLRHTATTLLVRQGVHPRVAMEILGHSQISVTMDVYAHVVGDSVKDAFASIEGALGGEK
jgi:integrase